MKHEPTHTWTCTCGATLERYRGQGDQVCGCGTEYNAFGQRLAKGWQNRPENRSMFDSSIEFDDYAY